MAEARRFELPRPLTNPNCLANNPLQPLGYASIYITKEKVNVKLAVYTFTFSLASLAERVGFEPTVGYKPTPIFKTGAINQLDHLSVCLTTNIY